MFYLFCKKTGNTRNYARESERRRERMKGRGATCYIPRQGVFDTHKILTHTQKEAKYNVRCLYVCLLCSDVKKKTLANPLLQNARGFIMIGEHICSFLLHT